jgi:hypothetical protein
MSDVPDDVAAPGSPANGDGHSPPPSRVAELMPVSSTAATVLAIGPKKGPAPATRERISRATDPAVGPANPVSSRAVSPDTAAPVVPPALWRRGWFQAVLAASVVLVAAGVGWGIRLAIADNTSPPERKSPPSPKPPLSLATVARLVEAQTANERAFPTLAEALARVKTGDRIQVVAELLETSLSLKGDSLPPGVTLEGMTDEGKAVHWQAPANHPPGQPLLELHGLVGWKVRGFLFDGQDRLEALTALSGNCPGLTLEDVQFEGFCRCAVRITNCAGDEAQPVALLRARFCDAAAEAAALQICADGNEVNRYLQVLDSRFEGPCRSAVDVLGGVTGLLLKGNRFFKTADGLFYTKQKPDQPFQAVLESNTYCQVKKALHFGNVPPGVQTQLNVTNNLFSETKKLAHVEGFAPQPSDVKARWIWYPDEGNPLNSAPVENRYFRKTFDVSAAPSPLPLSPGEERGRGEARAYLDIVCDRQFTVWLNGELVDQRDLGQSSRRTFSFNRRVYTFDVTSFLRDGKNVLAVQAKNAKKDGHNGPAGLLAQLSWTGAEGPPTVSTNSSWLASKTGPEGWQQLAFDDSKWKPARGLADYSKGRSEWKDLLWESMLREQFPGSPWPVLVTPRGNVRDAGSVEGFPLLGSRTLPFTLPTDPTKDAQFLRYSPTSTLFEAGSGKTPVGAPPPEP